MNVWREPFYTEEREEEEKRKWDCVPVDLVWRGRTSLLPRHAYQYFWTCSVYGMCRHGPVTGKTCCVHAMYFYHHPLLLPTGTNRLLPPLGGWLSVGLLILRIPTCSSISLSHSLSPYCDNNWFSLYISLSISLHLHGEVGGWEGGDVCSYLSALQWHMPACLHLETAIQCLIALPVPFLPPCILHRNYLHVGWHLETFAHFIILQYYVLFWTDHTCWWNHICTALHLHTLPAYPTFFLLFWLFVHFRRGLCITTHRDHCCVWLRDALVILILPCIATTCTCGELRLRMYLACTPFFYTIPSSYSFPYYLLPVFFFYIEWQCHACEYTYTYKPSHALHYAMCMMISRRLGRDGKGRKMLILPEEEPASERRRATYTIFPYHLQLLTWPSYHCQRH